MDEAKRNDDGGSIWFVILKRLGYRFGYSLGFMGVAAAILFLFPSVRELLERIATSFFG